MSGTPAGPNLILPAWLRQEIEQPVPSTLWHYTTASKLEKMLASGELWATHVRYLNDADEFIHVLEIAQKVFSEEEFKKAEVAELISDYVEWEFAEGSFSEKGLQVYTVSFSNDDDSIGQWDRYALGQEGVAIGFQLGRLRPPPEVITFPTLGKCIYKDDQKLDFTRRALMMMVDEERRIRHEAVRSASVTGSVDLKSESAFLIESTDRLNKKLVDMAQVLLVLASFCKHKGYVAEAEWRLALPVSERRPLEHMTRATREDGTPYLRVPLARIMGGELPIAEVMLNRHARPEDKERVERALAFAGLRNSRVTKSTIRSRE